MKEQNLNTPLVSVVVASYNYQDLIKEAIDSILCQTYTNFEVIVVDDGSKDNSVSVIKEYVSQHHNVKLFTHPNNENRGLPATVQLGIEQSHGDYIAFLESDDLWMPTYLEKKMQIIKQHPDVKIISNGILLFGNEQVIEEKKDYFDTINSKLKEGRNVISLDEYQYLNPIPTFSCVMFSADELHQVNFKATVPAWLDIWIYRQVLSHNELYHIPEKLTKWRMHATSYNNKKNSDGFAKKLDLMNKQCREITVPLISAIILYENNLEDMKQTIASVINQTYRYIEIIALAPTELQHHLNSFIEQLSIDKKLHRRIKFIENKKESIGNVLKHCIHHTTGQYITLLHAGDCLDKHCFEKRDEFLKINGDISVVVNKCTVSSEQKNNPFILTQLNSVYDSLKHPWQLVNHQLLAKGLMLVPICSIMISRKEVNHLVDNSQQIISSDEAFVFYFLFSEYISYIPLSLATSSHVNTCDELSEKSTSLDSTIHALHELASKIHKEYNKPGDFAFTKRMIHKALSFKEARYHLNKYLHTNDNARNKNKIKIKFIWHRIILFWNNYFFTPYP